MTTKTKVIAWKNLPTRFPTYQTVLAWLLLDRFHVPGYVYGIVGTVLAFLWVGSIMMMCKEEKAEPTFWNPSKSQTGQGPF